MKLYVHANKSASFDKLVIERKSIKEKQTDARTHIVSLNTVMVKAKNINTAARFHNENAFLSEAFAWIFFFLFVIFLFYFPIWWYIFFLVYYILFAKLFFATHLHFIYVIVTVSAIPSSRCLDVGFIIFLLRYFFACVLFRFVWFGSLAFHLHRVTVSRFRIYSICYARCAAYSSDYIKINGYQKLCVFLVWENEIEEEKENGNWIGTVACNCILDQEFTNKNVMNVAVFSI